MHRRRLLALCGTLAAGAGCSGPLGAGKPSTPDAAGETTDDPTPPSSEETAEKSTRTPRPTTTDRTATGALRVSHPAVQPGVVSSISEDAIGVVDAAGQYFVAAVSATADPPPTLEEIAFHFDGTAVTADEYDGYLYRNGERDAIYADGEGWLVFPLPETGDATGTRLTWPGGEWIAPDGLRGRLIGPQPSLSVSLWSTDRVGPDETPTIALSVTNEGTMPTTAALALNRSGPIIDPTATSRITATLGPGETKGGRQPAVNPYVHGEANAGPVTYYLEYPGGKTTTTIRPARESPTPEGTQQAIGPEE